MWTPEARKAAAAKRRLNAEEKRRLKVLADHGVTVGSGGSYGASSTMGRARVGGERYPVSHSGRHLGIVWREDGIKGYHVYPGLTSVPTYRANDPVSTHASLPEAAAALAIYQQIHVPAELTTPIRRPAEKPPPKPKPRPSRTPVRGRKTEADPYPHDLGYVKRIRGGKHAGTHRAYYWAYGDYGLRDREEYLGAFPTHG